MCSNNQLTELNVSKNTELYGLACSENQLTELDLSNNTELYSLWCNNNLLTELDLSNNTELYSLGCSNNLLAELDLSNIDGLDEISCHGNRLKKIDLGYRKILAEGNGWVGFSNDYFSAVPMSGCTFDGWYTSDGKLLGTEPELVYWDLGLDYDVDEFIAKFSGEPVFGDGDVDGNGKITTDDALAAIRNSMGLLDMSADQIAAADVDGDGEITTSDALTIIRIAMELID